MPDISDVVEKLEAPMPWIGTYAAVASVACTLAMAADVYHGFRRRKYWFRSRYFTLNATSLAMLAVAMKLPVDLTTKMYSVPDRLAKVSSLAFMSIAMANFSTSLGSMDNQSLLVNVAALGIMVITIAGNVCIQIIQMRSYLHARRAFLEESAAMGLMLLLLLMLVSSAVATLSTKQYLSSRYSDVRSSALDEEEEMADMRRASEESLRALVEKYWVMAETSSPQFVIARSVTSTVCGVVSLMAAAVLVEAEIRIVTTEGIFDRKYSSYKQSTRGILLCQSVGVVVGAVAPVSRWFVAINHRASTGFRNNIGNAFRVEVYWTQKLVEWRQRSLSLEIQHHKSRKFLHDLKGLVLDVCVLVQHMIVLASKLVLALSICTTRPIRSCLDHTWSRQERISHESSRKEAEMRRYVIQLEGETELPQGTLRNIFTEVDVIIKRGNTRNLENLLNLLSKSRNFEGVREFDSYDVPSLHPHHLPYCWSLPVATLACIALAIPGVGSDKSESLLRGVADGLRYVKLVDKILDREKKLAKARAAADAVGVDAELHRRWQNKGFEQISVRGKNAEGILKQLSEDSKKTVLDFMNDSEYSPIVQNWPPEVISANSMYRVSKTIMLSREGETGRGGEGVETDEQLFERLSVMIADIVAACLTNLPRAITIKCHRNAIEERARSVRKAATYLGETENIIKLLQNRQLLTPRAAYIEKWRASVNPHQPAKDHIAIDAEDHMTRG